MGEQAEGRIRDQKWLEHFADQKWLDHLADQS